MRKQTDTHNAYCSLKEYFHLCSVQALPWVPEGFFFRSEATIVSGEAAIVILAREEKKTLWTRQLQVSLPCVFVLNSVVDWSLYVVPDLSV